MHDQREPEIEAPLRELLRRGREVRPGGFTDRAVGAVRRDVSRRRVLRWSALAAPLAACAVLALLLGSPAGSELSSEHELAQLLSTHDQVVVASPRLDDVDALAALVVADFEETAGLPRLEAGEEDLARLILGS